ncbi:MAG: tetratricopeptide repeat protein [Caulobacteraceae bacterium]|nr:tetratricopeptide repeat protein [Caulobacteraceae bacterium]
MIFPLAACTALRTADQPPAEAAANTGMASLGLAAWALRETSNDRRRAWFRQEGGHYLLDESIRGAVAFELRNIAADDHDLWAKDAYDVVFCRNALMYFTQDQAIRAIQRIAYSLRPGGCFFLGHAETLRGLSEDFHLRHSGDAFYYQRKDAPPPRRIPRPARAPATAAPDHVAWVDVIRLASERVEALAGRASAFNLPTLPPGRRDLGPALDLMRRERFTEALVLLRELRPESGEDPEALLLEAMLLTNGGRFADAEEVCRRLLAVDGSNAGARCAMALCREAVGDPEGAAEHDRIAVHLDPGFAMPRLHLGLLARRAGERSVARQELGEALALLRREDAGRLLLFGGGFGRDALIALCRSALIECGGPP